VSTGRPPIGARPPRQEARARLADSVPIVTTGVVVGLLTVVLSISMATMVYTGDLLPFLPNGIGLALLSTAIVGTVFALAGSMPGTAAFSQLAPGAILAIVALSAVGALPDDALPITRFMTVVALIALTTMAGGLTFLVVGLFRLGRLVRYMPYPVVGGFIAGTGWLLLSGGIRVMTDVSPSLSYLTDLLAPGVWARWVPGIALSVIVVVVTGRARHPLAFPLLIAAATGGFYAAMALTGGSAAAWRDGGLLLGPFPGADLLRPLQPNDLQHVDWGVVASHGAGGASVVFMSLMAILFNATALELAIGGKIDLNRDLRAAGLGNLLAGSVGGTVGYQALSLTMLNHRLRSGHRLTPLVSVVVVIVTLVYGTSLLEFVPRLVVGGVLAYLGIAFLIEWLHGAYARLSRLEYAVVVAILLAIVAFGFLPGVGIGLVLAVALFVVAYGRIDVVRHALTGASMRSRVTWSPEERAHLEGQGERLMVLQLQGFLFFGSVHALVERVERRLETGDPLEGVIVDFRHVSGMDATASATFIVLSRLAESEGFTLLLADLPPALAKQLERAGLRHEPEGVPAMRVLGSLDEALEWCERRLLAQARGSSDVSAGLDDRLAELIGDDRVLQDLLPHLERIDVPAGGRFILQGDRADDIYLVATGRVTARLERQGDPALRLETMHGGNLVGEIGFYTGHDRGATVIADEPTTLYRLTHTDLAAIAARDPRLTAAFHRLVARRLAERVAHLQRVVAALQP
jgi:sulfate permease, SulP family